MTRTALALLTILALGAGTQSLAADDDPASTESQDAAATPDTPEMAIETPTDPATTGKSDDPMPMPADTDSKQASRGRILAQTPLRRGFLRSRTALPVA
jgi:hypothetical protein